MKKRYKPKPGTKAVRIDHRTVIEVSVDKPDEQAIEEYLEKLEHSRTSNYSFGDKRHKK